MTSLKISARRSRGRRHHLIFHNIHGIKYWSKFKVKHVLWCQNMFYDIGAGMQLRRSWHNSFTQQVSQGAYLRLAEASSIKTKSIRQNGPGHYFQATCYVRCVAIDRPFSASRDPTHLSELLLSRPISWDLCNAGFWLEDSTCQTNSEAETYLASPRQEEQEGERKNSRRRRMGFDKTKHIFDR